MNRNNVATLRTPHPAAGKRILLRGYGSGESVTNVRSHGDTAAPATGRSRLRRSRLILLLDLQRKLDRSSTDALTGLALQSLFQARLGVDAGDIYETGTSKAAYFRCVAHGGDCPGTLAPAAQVLATAAEAKTIMESAGDARARSTRLSVPGVHDGSVICVLDLESRRSRGFNAAAVAYAQAVAEKLAAAIGRCRLSSIDGLTGLPNRRRFGQRLSAAIEGIDEGGTLGVLTIDVDEFQNVNDTLGHTAGDKVLIELAKRLSAHYDDECVARLGGDGFIVLLNRLRKPGQAAIAAHEVEQLLALPVCVAGQSISIGASIGISLFPQDGVDAETLVMNADTAMNQAKREGRGSFRFFSPAMHAAAAERLGTELTLRRAVADEAFALEYQPIHDRSGAIAAFEALVRWPQADGSQLQPGCFIPIAEETGCIVALGAWVLRTACRQGALWNAKGAPVRICVNVSQKQIADPGFARSVAATLAESGLAPELLELELTETSIALDPKACARVIGDVRALGVRISLDDFGTGFNCLANLRTMTVDSIKLDRCFVTDIASSPMDRAIASGVICAARVMGANVIAEGVETQEQLDALHALQCDEIQGYLLGRPAHPDAHTEWLATQAPSRPSLRTWLAA